MLTLTTDLPPQLLSWEYQKNAVHVSSYLIRHGYTVARLQYNAYAEADFYNGSDYGTETHLYKPIMVDGPVQH